jgi:uncharacterized alkaline shock family protein YloU
MSEPDMSGPDLFGARLACGASADDLLAQVAEGRADECTAHQRRCTHCQATLAEYDRAWAPVRELAAENVHAPGAILEAALRRIRGAAENPTYGLLTNGAGMTRIAARVVVVTARETAARVPGVRVALSRLHPADSGGLRVDAGLAGKSTAIELALAADYGHDLKALAERIRSEVSAGVRALTGLDPVAVSVVIDDVFS